MLWILPLSFLIIFELVADVFAKEYSLKDKWYFWVGALLAYVIANIFWLSAIKNGSGLAKGAIIFSVASAILATVIGIIFYKEEVGTIQIIGFILGIISIALIFWE